MAEINQKVMSMVEEEVKKNPKATTTELYDRAKKIDKSVGELTARQFNARYPLQVKRRLQPTKRRKGAARPRKRTAAAEGDRSAVRGVLLELVRDVAAAEDRAELVGLVADMDGYVDRVLKASSGKGRRGGRK